MRAFTVRAPWSWAIARGFKDVENRKQAFTYTGLLMIHAGAQLADAEAFRTVADLVPEEMPLLGSPGGRTELALGAVIAVADLVGVHRSNECNSSCSPWAQQFQAHHLIRNPRILKRPVPANGRLGLWAPDEDLIAAVRRQLS